MRILIIRHGDPDYELDSLTPKGWREADLLALKLAKEKINAIYVSPLGRAQDTAKATLGQRHETAVTLDWLREFSPQIERPDRNGGKAVCWDWRPADWTTHEKFYDEKDWYNDLTFRKEHVKEEYLHVTECFDALLAGYGYKRDGRVYRCEEGNHDTIALFCHFGVEGVLLSHLIGVSPMPFWHGFCAAPTSVTTVYTEERQKGIASFRIQTFGDVSHLTSHDEKPAFAARYAECFEDDDAK